MDPSQLPTGQPLTLAAVILLGFGGLIAVIKFGLGRVAKSFEDMASAFKSMADKHESNERSLVRLEAIVQEGRSDIGEIKSTILNVLGRLRLSGETEHVHESGEHSRPIATPRRTARIKTPATGVPVRRANTDADR